jgi:hypothetical protein
VSARSSAFARARIRRVAPARRAARWRHADSPGPAAHVGAASRAMSLAIVVIRARFRARRCAPKDGDGHGRGGRECESACPSACAE